MNFIRIKAIPSADLLLQRYPLSFKAKQTILQHKKEIKRILSGEDHRLLMIIGPCSAWPRDAVIEYASRLKELEPQISDKIKIVMRAYIQKPRTTKGWTGPVNQPDPKAPPDIAAGMFYVREMMVKVVEMGLPIADECLFTHNAQGFSELVSWFAIGARSSEDHEHRIFASAADCPVGMKNPTHGSLDIAVNSLVAAQHPHVAAVEGYEVKTLGNPFAHLVLRGSNCAPNYSMDHLKEVQAFMTAKKIKHPAVLIDASHDNCLVDGKKNTRRQPEIIFEVLESLQRYPLHKPLVKGFMVESYLKEGAQQLEGNAALDLGGLSITDPCLGWEETQAMLLKLHCSLVACNQE